MTRAATTALRQLGQIHDTLRELTPTVIADLDRKARFTTRPDGYPSHTLSDGSSHTTAELTAVESAADRRANHHHNDPTGDAIAQLFDDLATAAHTMNRISRRLAYITNVHHTASRKPTTGGGTCGACHRDVPGTEDDRLRNGYCASCNTAWIRAGRPERTPWETERRAHLDAATTQSTSTVTESDTVHANIGAVGR